MDAKVRRTYALWQSLYDYSVRLPHQVRASLVAAFRQLLAGYWPVLGIRIKPCGCTM
jgi:hypothetical protein